MSTASRNNSGAIGLPRRLHQPTAYALRVLEACRTAERVMAGTAHPQEV